MAAYILASKRYFSKDGDILDKILHLKLNQKYSASDINFWVQVAVNRSVRELRIDLFGKTLELPCCLCSCITLKELTLHDLCIKVVPAWFRLPSLKTLHLLSVKFSSDGFVASILRICPVLERLVVDGTKGVNVKIPNMDVPNLRSLSFRSTGELRIELLRKTLGLPTCLSSFRNLTELILHGLGIKGFPPCFRFASLKTLRLSSVKLSVASLLKICPVLECLIVENVMIPNIYVPSLRSLSIRSSRELRIDLSLKTFRTLKELILHELSIKVVPPSFSLPSLEALHLLSVKFFGDESVASLLKICPVLEHLVVDQIKNENVMITNIDVPTLRNLSIRNSKGKGTYVEGSKGFVIKAPSLTDLNFEDTLSNFLMFEPMPEVIKADIQVICDQSENFIGSLTSIQHLSLCSLTSKTPYPACTVFSSLKYLELCTCSARWANLFACILNAAPELRSLKLKSDAQILDSLHLKLRKYYIASDINFLVQLGVNRSMRELRIDFFGKTLELPCCLSTCTTLKVLVLDHLNIMSVPGWFRLPSVETLQLSSVTGGSNYVPSLIRLCSVHERLVVDQIRNKDLVQRVTVSGESFRDM
ncbi:unnamed protein product [Arabidopsis thaliana]|uniref:(thale cress) hypothetical protein n=1 Tax=Arabidopsis thaliana TaxID=3702 RepID=A0A7G2FGL4_ARATH|nr:unnamed protein product [Arabidopsis thaliana]